MKQPKNNIISYSTGFLQEQSKKLTILYARLSKEDVLSNDDSYSIQNQQQLLEKCAKEKGLANTLFLKDDGLSGVFSDTRDGFNKMLSLIKEGVVGTVIVKDLSRLYRNYRDAGELTETILPHYNIRLIALGDGVDKTNEYQKVRLNSGIDINIAFKNLMNEVYVQDLSNKLRLAQAAKSNRGYAIGKPPYGYVYGTEDKRRWVIDEEAADYVKQIYAWRLEGLSCEKIALKLNTMKILIPTAYAISKGRKSPKYSERGNSYWSTNTVRTILINQAYVGDVINFKTYTNSYKDRRTHQNERENMDIHLDVHEAIIERSLWEKVQKTFKRNVRKATKHIEKNMLAGYLVCSDCGANLSHKHRQDNPANDSFSCNNFNRMAKLCNSTHHIRVDHITELITSSIAEIVRFVRDYEDDFVKIVIDEKYKEVRLQSERNKRQLAAAKARDEELNLLYGQIYEDKNKGILPEDRFIMLAQKYDKEQQVLKSTLKHLQKQVAEEAKREVNASGFIEMVQRYTNVNELTPEILREFIDKVVVHHRMETKKIRTQQIDIYFNMVGIINLPNTEEHKKYLTGFSRTKKENQIAEAI